MFGFFKKKQKAEAKPRVYAYRPAAERLYPPTRSQSVARPVPATPAQSSDEDFGLSMAFGMATDNALLGYAAGGSMIGGLVGAEMSESSSKSESVSSSCE